MPGELSTLHLISENPTEELWLHLAALESKEVAVLAIRDLAASAQVTVPDTLVERKAVALAYFTQTAREYLADPPPEWSKRILVTYYGLLSLASALLVADPRNEHDLLTVEGTTDRGGHGLNNVDEEGEVPLAQRVYVRPEGFFAEYLKASGIDTEGIAVDKKLKSGSIPVRDVGKLVSLLELLARVPELARLYYSVVGEPPLTALIYPHLDYPTEGDNPGRVQITFQGVIDLPEDFVRNHLKPNLTDLQHLPRGETMPPRWAGHLEYTRQQPWQTKLHLHQSSRVSLSLLAPVLGKIGDQLAIYLMAAYLLSILVRYRPSIWRQMLSPGRHLPLIRGFVGIVARIAPEIALQRLRGRHIRVSPAAEPISDLLSDVVGISTLVG